MKKLAKIFCLVTILVLSLVIATACETLENHKHTPATEWLSDGTNHYHACTFEGCTEKLDVTPCSGGTATCQHKAVCSVCNAEYGELGAHVYNKQVATESYLKDAATHQLAAVYYKSCECGANGTETFTSGDVVAHVFDQEVATDEYLATPATHSAAATYYKSCECGAKGAETFIKGDPIPHVFDKEIVSVDFLKDAATCTSAAVYYKSCECGAKGTETFTSGEALGHNWVDDEANSTPASWTSAGVHAEKCSNAGCAETKTTTIECLSRTLVIDNGDDVVANWDVKKYENGWVTTNATATKSDGASHDDTNATTFKIWHNSMSFRFGTVFDAEGKDYNVIVADIKGDGIAKVKIRLRNSESGVYATYTMPVALQSGWYHYELPLSGDGWVLDGVSSAEAKHFDIIEFIFQTTVDNGPTATIIVDNVAIKNIESPALKMESLTPAKTGPLLKLDFEDGAGSGNYTNASWTQEQYNTDWTSLSNQMNSRTKNNSNVINFVCSQGMTRRFTYAIGQTLDSVNYISIDLGNYHSPNKDIKYKVVLIDASGNSHYMGGSSDWIVFSANDTLQTVDYTFTTAVKNVVAVRVVTQGTSGNQYLYADNLILDYVD